MLGHIKIYSQYKKKVENIFIEKYNGLADDVC